MSVKTSNQEFAEFLKGNFIHIGDDMYYILSYEKSLNRFFLTGSGDNQNFNRQLYMYELVTLIKQNDCELYSDFVNTFPEYFI